ncbi:MAG: HIT domain-containing protein [Helicobacter sp.]|nr:HIT domain-containing protein [Helicobacter sp.]
MQRIYSPWRAEYFDKSPSSCIFCEISKNPQNDDKNFVFYRDSRIFGVMNLYPYTPGHILLIPHDHIKSPELLDPSIYTHLFEIAKSAMLMLYDFGADGINMGLNIQKAAGAGIPDHLHLHLLPRFENDANFMLSIFETRVYGHNFEQIFQQIKTLAQKYLPKDKI